MSTIDHREERIADALKVGHEIIHANDLTLTLDFDDVKKSPDLRVKLDILRETVLIDCTETWRSKSRTGWHVVIHLVRPLPFHQRIAIQAALGSDWKRELLYARMDYKDEPFLIKPGLKHVVLQARKKIREG